MIADYQTNVVFVADTLERRFPTVFQELKSILTNHGIPLGIIPGTRDIWCRDYMPIQVAEDRFVQFRYAPDYLTGKYRHLRADGEIGPNLPWIKNCVTSEFVLDGGNIIAWGGRGIVTDKVFSENPGRSRKDVAEQLRGDLGLTELIVIPEEPYDPIGHADGMACWLDADTLLINDYSSLGQLFRRRVHRSLRRHRIEVVELPYKPQRGSHNGMPTAVGNWINFLRVRDLLIVPVFGLKADDQPIRMLLELHPGYAVEVVDCRELALEGGLLRCVTWQARKPRNDAHSAKVPMVQTGDAGVLM